MAGRSACSTNGSAKAKPANAIVISIRASISGVISRMGTASQIACLHSTCQTPTPTGVEPGTGTEIQIQYTIVVATAVHPPETRAHLASYPSIDPTIHSLDQG